MSEIKTSSAALLINETMELMDQIKVLDELIATTPPGSPAIVLTLSVALVQHILETRNNDNRKARPKKIKRFAADLTGAFWMLTGDTVKFGTNGALLDGQNRLAGALTAGVPITTYVVFAIDPVAFKYLDSGTVRTGGDTFVVAKVPNAEITGKAVRWLMIFEDPKMERGISVPNAELFEHYQRRVNKDLLGRQVVKAKDVSRVIPTGILAAMLYLFERKDPDKAKIFAHDLQKEMRGGGTLISRLTKLKKDNLGRMNEKTITAFTVLAWNHYRATDNNSITASGLRWTDAGPHPVIQ